MVAFTVEWFTVRLVVCVVGRVSFELGCIRAGAYVGLVLVVRFLFRTGFFV